MLGGSNNIQKGPVLSRGKHHNSPHTKHTPHTHVSQGWEGDWRSPSSLATPPLPKSLMRTREMRRQEAQTCRGGPGLMTHKDPSGSPEPASPHCPWKALHSPKSSKISHTPKIAWVAPPPLEEWWQAADTSSLLSHLSFEDRGPEIGGKSLGRIPTRPVGAQCGPRQPHPSDPASALTAGFWTETQAQPPAWMPESHRPGFKSSSMP